MLTWKRGKHSFRVWSSCWGAWRFSG